MQSIFSHQVVLEPDDSIQLATLCGPFDAHLKQIETRLGITIQNRGNRFHISGEETLANAAGKLLSQLYREVRDGTAVTAELVHLFLQESGIEDLLKSAPEDVAIIETRKKSIKARGQNQKAYVQAIRGQDISFGIGPAGTGKTFLAVACAVEALEQESVRRILLVRPAVEAGEKLGFLPGDLSQKIDPYLRPLYDALYELLGFDLVERLIEKNVIEVAPLAYMRGRTLNDSFIILDESQNTTAEQMKMFLTRFGQNSRMVVCGDPRQVDIPGGDGMSGLADAVGKLEGVDGFGTIRFTAADVVRHPIVGRIVEAYEGPTT